MQSEVFTAKKIRKAGVAREDNVMKAAMCLLDHACQVPPRNPDHGAYSSVTGGEWSAGSMSLYCA